MYKYILYMYFIISLFSNLLQNILYLYIGNHIMYYYHSFIFKDTKFVLMLYVLTHISFWFYQTNILQVRS